MSAPGRAEATFVRYDAALLRNAGVDAQASALLVEVGLPQFVELTGEFVALNAEGLETWHAAGLPRRYFPIGSNGAVEFLVIEPDTGQVYKLSSNWERSDLVNSSVAQLAECLCLFAEHAEINQWHWFAGRVCEIDAAAGLEGCHWRDLADDLRSFG